MLLGRDALPELDESELPDLTSGNWEVSAPRPSCSAPREVELLDAVPTKDEALTAGLAPLVAISNKAGTHRASV